MSEQPPTSEVIQNEGMQTHGQFVADRRSSIASTLKKVLGWGLVGMGVIFALDGIGQFVFGTPPSSLLSQIDSGVISHLAQHLAQMPLTTKTGGGMAMMSTGEYLLRLSTNSIKMIGNKQLFCT